MNRIERLIFLHNQIARTIDNKTIYKYIDEKYRFSSVEEILENDEEIEEKIKIRFRELMKENPLKFTTYLISEIGEENFYDKIHEKTNYQICDLYGIQSYPKIIKELKERRINLFDEVIKEIV